MSDYLKVFLLRLGVALGSFLYVYINKRFFIESFELLQKEYVFYVFWTGIGSLSIPAITQYFAAKNHIVFVLKYRWIIPLCIALIILLSVSVKMILIFLVPIGVLIEVCISYLSGRENYLLSNGISIVRFIPWFLAILDARNYVYYIYAGELVVLVLLWLTLPNMNLPRVNFVDEITQWRSNIIPFISSYGISKGMPYFASVLMNSSSFIEFRLVMSLIATLGIVVSSYMTVSVNRKLKGSFKFSLISEFLFLLGLYTIGFPLLYILNQIICYIDELLVWHILFGLSMSLRLLISNHFYTLNLNKYRFINDLILLFMFVVLLKFVNNESYNLWTFLSLGFMCIQFCIVIYAESTKNIGLHTR